MERGRRKREKENSLIYHVTVVNKYFLQIWCLINSFNKERSTPENLEKKAFDSWCLFDLLKKIKQIGHNEIFLMIEKLLKKCW